MFRRLKTIKQKLNKQMPEACEAVMGAGAGTEAREEDDEYDEAIRRRRMEQVRDISVTLNNASDLMQELHDAANKTNE